MIALKPKSLILKDGISKLILQSNEKLLFIKLRFLNELSRILCEQLENANVISKMKITKNFDLPLNIKPKDTIIHTVSVVKRLIRSEWSLFKGGGY